MKNKVFYYADPVNDDFANFNIKQIKLPPDYKYFTKNPLRKVAAFIAYRLIATPFAFVYQKLRFHEKIIGRKKLKKYRKTGYFLYGNHTRIAGDAFCPSMVTFPKKAFILTNPDSVSILGIKRLVEDLGAVPLPTDKAGVRNFTNAVKTHAEMGHVLVIFPEAHIWPCYTDIRPFKDSAFRYPAEVKTPVFTFTCVYKKQKFFNLPKNYVYIDGPFFANESSTPKENQRYLRDICYETMKSRAAESTYKHIQYIKKTDEKSPAD